MANQPDPSAFKYPRKTAFKLGKAPTSIDKLYKNKLDYKEKLNVMREEIHLLQEKLYAENRHAVLVIFQATDTAGKDGTIDHVFNGIDPHGLEVHAFKRPTSTELDQDFLWRTTVALPSRGKIAVHNRSHYEEVLACRVHPDIITDIQRLPLALTKNMDKLYQGRFESIRDQEKHLVRNGTRVIKFFLHLSKEEQRNRLLARIDDPEKHWKYEPGDLKERGYWDKYQKAYEEAIQETATEAAPWYVIPADDKRNMRLLVAAVLCEELRALNPDWPKVNVVQLEALAEGKKMLLAED
ncbi:polyphosphate kinase 2 family protein [Phragmitibacter flavus]|uniref:Polyphosphate kinase 2 family protein n=1 Tax=Phragmitibacter flavus TaxID=2576071 RepID=A0A5R8KI05_9BACT|nr:PPK2 family polyphosphate kinase [Phragmitibacter flavus]TLD71953.1 polyphosphate kinase 2 family protein [Phragmitibacter flavus]